MYGVIITYSQFDRELCCERFDSMGDAQSYALELECNGVAPRARAVRL